MAGLGLQTGGPVVESAVDSITIVQSTSGDVANSGSAEPLTITLTLGATPIAGNQLIAACGDWRAGGTAWASAQGNKWTWETSTGAELNNCSVGNSVADGVTSSFTFTNNAANSSGTTVWAFLMEVSGLAPAALDHSVNVTSSTAGVSTTSANYSLAADTNSASELIVFAVVISELNPGTLTLTNLTQLMYGNNVSGATNTVSFFVGYHIATSALSPTGGISWSGSGCYEAGYAVSYIGSAPPGPGASDSPGIVVPMPAGVNRMGVY